MYISIGPIKEIAVINNNEIFNRIEKSIDKRKYYHIVLLDWVLFIKCLFYKDIVEAVNNSDLVLAKGLLLTKALRWVIPCVEKLKQINWDEAVDTEVPDDFNYLPVESSGDNLINKIKNQAKIQDNSSLSLMLIRHFEKREQGFFFLGDSLRNVHIAAKKIKMSFPHVKILGTHPKKHLKKYHDDFLEKIKKVAPHILFTDLNSGYNEKWINDNKDYLSQSVCIGVDGDVKKFAGLENDISNILQIFSNGKWLYPFYFISFFIIFILYKSLKQKEVQCHE